MNNSPKTQSCLDKLTAQEPNLDGSGVIISIIDSGIDYSLPDFQTATGETRILAIWDQTATPDIDKGLTPPTGYSEGVLYSQTMINKALKGLTTLPVRDTTGHGTAVASIAAGTTSGIATNSEILVIKLGKSINNSFPKTTQLMRAIDYSVKYAATQNKPIAINISFGNTYGDHKGNSLIERFIDNASEVGKTSIIIGSGNEGTSNGHVSGIANTETLIELSVSNYQPSFNLQLWKYYQDIFNITITSPSGNSYTIDNTRLLKSDAIRITLETSQLLCYIGTPQPYNIEQEIFIDFIPQENYITSGIWQITLTPISIVTGEYRLYLSSYTTRNLGTGFITPNPNMTITIPATSRKAISVGAYDTTYKSYADFSGRGYVYRYEGYPDNIISEVKPDLVAPGVNLTVPLPGGGYDKVSGTSFATPFVTGACALLMEWGIVRGNDKYMYGERLKAVLTAGAKPVGLNDIIPNPKIGWGSLCVFSSFW